MSRKTALVAAAFLIFFTATLQASYIVVMKDGTRYRAKERWTMVDGKAMLALENGQTLQIEAGLIDIARTDEVNRSGLGDVRVIASPAPRTEPAAERQAEPSLGALTRIRRIDEPQANAPTNQARTSASPAIRPDVISRFNNAYENIGLFGTRITATSASTLKIELVTETEDQVFNALLATALMVNRLPGVSSTKIDSVDLLMTTIKGASAGRFLMTSSDAEAVDKREIPVQKYFVDKVIF
jgi:hypothetical protein